MEQKTDEKPQVIKDDLDEKPEQWKPLSDLSNFGSNVDDLDKTNWDSLDYSCSRDENWYRERFGGFSEEIIKILAHCDGTNKRPENEKNEWEKRQALEQELKEKLTVKFD